jgi:integrase
MANSEMSIYTSDGKRKYLCKEELKQFLAAADSLPPRERAFCWTLAHSGGRLAEVLALRKQDIDRKQSSVIIKSLKKRDRTHHRSVPIPPALIATLELVFDLRRGKQSQVLWDVTIRQANRWIMRAMEAAGLEQHSPRSLRHSFGVSAVMAGVPLNMIQKWLGHADIKTTAIYTNAMGGEEHSLAARMWS